MFLVFLFVLCILLYCCCFAGKEKEEKKKKKKEKKTKTKTKKKKVSTAPADKTTTEFKSETWGPSESPPKAKVKKNPFAGKVGLLAKKTGKLSKESTATVFDPSHVTMRSGMVAGKMSAKQKLLKGKYGSVVSGTGKSGITMRSKASGQKKIKSKGAGKLGKPVSSRRSAKSARGRGSNVSSFGNQSSAISKPDDKVTSFPSRKESDVSILKLNAPFPATRKGKMSKKLKKPPK